MLETASVSRRADGAWILARLGRIRRRDEARFGMQSLSLLRCFALSDEGDVQVDIFVESSILENTEGESVDITSKSSEIKQELREAVRGSAGWLTLRGRQFDVQDVARQGYSAQANVVNPLAKFSRGRVNTGALQENSCSSEAP